MFHFNAKKMTQAVGVLIRKPGVDSRNYYKLLKLLYLAERQSLIETGHPVTGDVLMAMPHGPVLRSTCDLMRARDTRPEWQEYFELDGPYDLTMLKDPGDDLLCDYEIKILEQLAIEHKDKTWRQIRNLCHELPEQKKNDPGKSSKEIPIEDILEVGGALNKLDCAKNVAALEVAFARTFGK